jgi:glycosyltransferase involved in cell wall biosynthesis
MAGAQVMTAWERDEYIAAYGLDANSLHLVRWPLREGGDGQPAPIEPASRRVFSSGRTACDWPTLFDAATGADWELTVVCSHADASAVGDLAQGLDRVRIEVELPWGEHDRLLRSNAVCAVVIADRGLSAGQVRLMSAVEAGVPVVATAVRALDEYVVAGETAVVVAPGDAVALRAAVDGLLADPQRRGELRDRARAHADSWTYVQYFDQLREVIGNALRGVR